MKVLFVDNHARGGQARKELTALGVGVAVAFLVALSPGSMMPEAEAAFPGRTGRIAFSAGLFVGTVPDVGGPNYGQPRDYDIFTASSRGTGINQVTQGNFIDLLPAWSPDGRTIAFARADVAPASDFDVYLIDADGGTPTNLTQTPLYREWEPAWSPEGTKLLFRSDRAAPEFHTRPFFALFEGDLFVMDVDGGNVVQLTSRPGGEMNPTWSPDGRWIAFRDSAADGIGLMKPDGSGRKLLSRFSGGTYGPEWSPDGRWIAVTQQPPGEIWVFDKQGRDARNLTRHEADDRWPVWSPNGDEIIFVSDRDGAFALYKMDADGSDVERLIDLDLPGDAPPDWGRRP